MGKGREGNRERRVRVRGKGNLLLMGGRRKFWSGRDGNRWKWGEGSPASLRILQLGEERVGMAEDA